MPIDKEITAKADEIARLLGELADKQPEAARELASQIGVAFGKHRGLIEERVNDDQRKQAIEEQTRRKVESLNQAAVRQRGELGKLQELVKAELHKLEPGKQAEEDVKQAVARYEADTTAAEKDFSEQRGRLKEAEVAARDAERALQETKTAWAGRLRSLELAVSAQPLAGARERVQQLVAQARARRERGETAAALYLLRIAEEAVGAGIRGLRPHEDRDALTEAFNRSRTEIEAAEQEVQKSAKALATARGVVDEATKRYDALRRAEDTAVLNQLPKAGK